MYDFIVIGGGMAGASAGYFLAARGRVLLLERESQPGYHSTGRSAALYTQAYGNAAIRALTIAGWPFFTELPEGFTEHPILRPRGAMFIGRADQTPAVEQACEEAAALVPTVRKIDAAEARRIVPVLREEYVAAAFLEPDAMDIDVHALHQGFLRGIRRSGEIVSDAEVTSIVHTGRGWSVETGQGVFEGGMVVNAAGAWADRVAAMAGVKPVGLVPKRRTAFLFDAPAGVESGAWPLVVDVDERFYFKPDAGKMLASPADETAVEPCDVQPEDLDVALAADRIQTATTMEIRRIDRRWAGLRSFVADKTPVVGFDVEAEGFFWLAGQGGYGIQTAPAMGRLAAALAMGEGVPEQIAARGLTEAVLSPRRLQSP